jgi:hypothetical protein
MCYSVLLGMKDYTDDENNTTVNQLIHNIDPYFNVIIYVEFVLKVMAMGFFWGEGTYLGDGWNWIDFVVVSSSLADLIMKLMA